MTSEDYGKIVAGFCKDVLKCSKDIIIDRVHALGPKKNNAHIIAHIPRDEDVDCIFRQAKTLQGTGYIVHRDFCQETRRKRGKLARLKKEITRVAGNKKMSIVTDRLVVEGVWFFWSEDMQLCCGKEEGAKKLKDMFNHDFSEFLKDVVKDSISSNE